MYLQNFLHGKCWEEIARAQGVDINYFNRHAKSPRVEVVLTSTAQALYLQYLI